ncbi:phage tail protein I [Desulfuromonas acetoxidans]|uniref:phage tail protein I n=1 Tax=Desulfuromonas acetoxidans TaxID=891 RepID=UPI00293100C3|nr:phage tail protein I [Desulfuromonas acetoxidans]
MSNSLLPANATSLERDLETVTARVADIPIVVGTLWNPQTCPASLLPWLAWALSVDDWQSDWPEATKRAVLAESLLIHCRKGTPWAVERALIAAGAPNATVLDWYRYEAGPGEPYHFKVVVDVEGTEVTAETESRLLQTINRAKNVRSVLDGIEYNLSVRSPVPVFAIGIQGAEIINVYPKE